MSLVLPWTLASLACRRVRQMTNLAASVLWLVSGGVAYSVGVIFFVLDSRLRYAHAVWHGFVATGTSCHFVAVLSYAA